MKKYLSTLVILLILILSLSACSGGNDTNNTSSSGTDTKSEDVMDSGTSDSKVVNTDLVGDWKYEGVVNDADYDINLDLENDGTYTLDVEDNTQENLTESELQGTYEATDDIITLNTATVNDPNSYFNPEIVADSSKNLNYKIDGNNLNLTNASDVLSILPNDFTLTRDD